MKKTLKEWREEKGLTQADMAKKLGYSDKSGYNHLENGNVRVTLEQARRIAEIFEIEIDLIFFAS